VSPGVEAEFDTGEAVDVAAALGRSGWGGLPARYKMVVASSVAFMVCNMVRSVVTATHVWQVVRTQRNHCYVSTRWFESVANLRACSVSWDRVNSSKRCCSACVRVHRASSLHAV